MGSDYVESQGLQCLQVHYFDRYWSNGKVKGFEVYIVELIESVEVCVARNIHNRSRVDIEKVVCTCTLMGLCACRY